MRQAEALRGNPDATKGRWFREDRLDARATHRTRPTRTGRYAVIEGSILLATLCGGAFLQLFAHSTSRLDGRIGLNRTATAVTPLELEHVHCSIAPDGAIAEHLNRVLQFVPDGCHEIAVRLVRVDMDPEHSVFAGHRDRE
jgi:hypothetical protein